MRFIIQRVKHASVTVENEVVGKIGPGLMILVGITEGDTDEFIDHITDKFLNLRLWDDSKGARWKECVKSLNYEILFVSQFTLYSIFKGNKPDYHFAMNGEPAKILFDKIVDNAKKKYDPNKIQTGTFGAMMEVDLCNDGPVTIQWEYPGDVAEKIEQNNKKKGNVKDNKKEKKDDKDIEKKKLEKIERRKEKKEKKNNKEEKKEDKKEDDKKLDDKKEDDKKEEDKKLDDKKLEDKKEDDKKEDDKKEDDKKEDDKKEDDKKEINEIDTTKKNE